MTPPPPDALVVGGPLIGALTTTNVVAVECTTDVVVPLTEEEEAVAGRFGPSRRQEFTTVRACARRALSELGIRASEGLVPGSRGAPRWPTGVTGSMTHCPGYRAAMVATCDTAAAIGIDAEPNASLPPEVVTVVCADSERSHVERLPESGVAWDRLVFSAKEAVYKVWSPATGGEWLGFEDVLVCIDPSGTFRASLRDRSLDLVGQRRQHLYGRWRVDAGLLVTAIVLPA